MDLKEVQKLVSLVTPELIEFLKLSQTADTVLIPVKGDKLILASEAAEVLKVNTTMISRYVREGLLKPVLTPHSNSRKYWLSEVMEIPKREVLS